MKISIVTPVLNEAHTLPLRAGEIAAQSGPLEWIVADGGSDDGSPEIAGRCGAIVCKTRRGRGPQLDAGARRATGDVLLFLHADSSLPRGALEAIRDALRFTTAVGGNFRFAFDDRTAAGRLFSAVYRTKQRIFGVWYGDSATFVRRDVFWEVGGYRDIPLFEDVEFVARLRRFGRTVRVPLTVVSSARRYRGRIVATALRWTALLAAYKLGFSPHFLATHYAPHDETSERRSALSNLRR